jgi:hypothetical protein
MRSSHEVEGSLYRNKGGGASGSSPRFLKASEIAYFLSMISVGGHIRLLREDVAIVHGSEEDEVEQGKRFPVRYV